MGTTVEDMNRKVLTDVSAKRFEPKFANSQNLTVDSVKKHMPKGASITVTQEIVDLLNNAGSSAGIDQDLFEENMLSYMHLAKKGGVIKLMNALKFYTLTQVPSVTNEQAYRIVFPDKAAELDARGASAASFASEFNNSTLVREITKLQVMGFYITHAHLKNWGMSKLVDLANGVGANPNDRVSPTVQLNSVLGILDKVTPPEDINVELRVGMNDEAKGITESLMEQLKRNADLKVKELGAGKNLDSIQGLDVVHGVIDAEVEE